MVSRAFAGSEREGSVTLVLESDIKLCLTSEKVPWVVGEASRDVLAKELYGSKMGEKQMREQCKRVAAPRAMFRDRNGDAIVSLKLNDKCVHEGVNWTRQSCGHNWCRRCQGYVHPVTKVVLKGPGPIVGCNRQIKPWERGEFMYGE